MFFLFFWMYTEKASVIPPNKNVWKPVSKWKHSSVEWIFYGKTWIGSFDSLAMTLYVNKCSFIRRQESIADISISHMGPGNWCVRRCVRDQKPNNEKLQTINVFVATRRVDGGKLIFNLITQMQLIFCWLCGRTVWSMFVIKRWCHMLFTLKTFNACTNKPNITFIVEK